MRVILLACFCLSVTVSFAQINFWPIKKPGDHPEKFPIKLLVDSGFVIGRIAISKDGREFYYTYGRKWFDRSGSGVMMRTIDSKKWGSPIQLADQLSEPTLSPDQQTLYFGGPKGSVWRSHREGNTWSVPARYLDNVQGFYNFMPTNSGTFYAGSNGNRGPKNNYAYYDFSVVQITPTDTVAISLGKPLNTDVFDGDFYISPDEAYMIISTKETPSFECELWISFKKDDHTWTAPVSLGDDINRGLAHRFGQYVTPDGKYLFYTYGTNETNTSIYWVRWDKRLQELKKKALMK